MKIRRIQVPNFRALKNIDITFEKELSPQIFPIGSLNGGGKSTLLQLIFTLLHCPLDSEKRVFLENILSDSRYEVVQGSKPLAKINLEDEDKHYTLTYSLYKESYVQQEIEEKSISKAEQSKISIENQKIHFSNIEELEAKKIDLEDLKSLQDEMDSLRAEIEKVNKSGKRNIEERFEALFGSIRNNKKLNSFYLNKSDKLRFYFENTYFFLKEYRSMFRHRKSESDWKPMTEELDMLAHDIKEGLEYLEEDLSEKILEINQLKKNKNRIFNYFDSAENIYLLHFRTYNSKGYSSDEEIALTCQIKCEEVELLSTEWDGILHEFSNKIFLAAPSTQIFLFLDKEEQKLIFESKRNPLSEDYYGRLGAAATKMNGLFTYDFLAVDLIINSFKQALSQDQENAIRNRGIYGESSAEKLFSEIDSMLGNKQLNIDPKLSQISFSLVNHENGKYRELYPENLSHGELKRLSIYMWLKYNDINDAIVLMDELEIAFHPEWQYRIVSDLEEWGPTNQYILATHSYDICEAVTPAHVKEIEPRLLSQDSSDIKDMEMV